jgi:hypothetical protein
MSKAGEIRTLPKTSLPVAVLKVAKGRIPKKPDRVKAYMSNKQTNKQTNKGNVGSQIFGEKKGLNLTMLFSAKFSQFPSHGCPRGPATRHARDTSILSKILGLADSSVRWCRSPIY